MPKAIARKGEKALNALMGALYGVQPTATHSDYLAAAQDLLRRHRKRAHRYHAIKRAGLI